MVKGKSGFLYLPKDVNGWVDASKHPPKPFELCAILLDNQKTLKGWYTGKNWMGLNIPKDQKVKGWKKLIN